jgi:hypothetical protein
MCHRPISRLICSKGAILSSNYHSNIHHIRCNITPRRLYQMSLDFNPYKTMAPLPERCQAIRRLRGRSFMVLNRTESMRFQLIGTKEQTEKAKLSSFSKATILITRTAISRS